MTLLQAIILGLVQGLAEFLPISSSGHLAVLEYLFKIKDDEVLLFAVLLHFGTLISIFLVYYMDIYKLILELGFTIKDIFTGKGVQINKNEHRKLGVLIVMATIPTGFFGVFFKDAFSGLYNSLLYIGIGFIITSILLFAVQRYGKERKEIKDFTLWDGFLVGLFQSAAIAPGISRSGSTIVGGLLTGAKREVAVRFAFLISIPSILGALIIEGKDALDQGIQSAYILPISAGVIVAAVTGFIAIKTMIKVVTNKKLHYFAYYTFTLGVIIIISTLINK
jgi:undecaprenyl-diphosphatase